MNNQESNISNPVLQSINDAMNDKIINRKKEPEQSGVISYNLGDKMVFDMRKALRGRYQDNNLQPGDVIIMSDKKIYKVLKSKISGATFIKMDTKEIQQLKEEVDLAVERTFKRPLLINKSLQ